MIRAALACPAGGAESFSTLCAGPSLLALHENVCGTQDSGQGWAQSFLARYPLRVTRSSSNQLRGLGQASSLDSLSLGP